MEKAKAKRITLEDLAAMTKNGFDEIGERIDGVEEKIGGVEEELKKFRKENSREYEKIKLRLDADRFCFQNKGNGLQIRSRKEI